MSEKNKDGTVKMVFAMPREPSQPNNHHLLHEEANTGNAGAAKMNGLKFSGGAAGMIDDISELNITVETREALGKALSDVTNALQDALVKLPAPAGVEAEDRTGGSDQAIFAPYMLMVSMGVLSYVVCQMAGNEGTTIDRAALVSEIVRNWAALVADREISDSGVPVEKAKNITSFSVINAPAPMSLVQGLHAARKALKAEAAQRGMSEEDLTKEKLAEIGIDLDAIKAKRPVRGEPAPDEDGGMLF